MIPKKFTLYFSDIYIIFYDFLEFKWISKVLKRINKLEIEKGMNNTGSFPVHSFMSHLAQRPNQPSGTARPAQARARRPTDTVTARTVGTVAHASVASRTTRWTGLDNLSLSMEVGNAEQGIRDRGSARLQGDDEAAWAAARDGGCGVPRRRRRRGAFPLGW
jgi:hypothetical protein